MPIGPFSSRDIPDGEWEANAAQWRADQNRYFADGSDTVSGGSGDDTVDPTGGAPRIGARRYGTGPILGLIARGESREGPEGYDMTYTNGTPYRYPAGWKKPSELTFDQWRALQPILRKTNGGDAMGKYQFKGETLDDLKRWMGLKGSEVMTPHMQDTMAEELLYRKRHYGDFLAGRITPQRFQLELAKEWRSLPAGPDGNSYRPTQEQEPQTARVAHKPLFEAITNARTYSDALNELIDGGQLPP